MTADEMDHEPSGPRAAAEPPPGRDPRARWWALVIVGLVVLVCSYCFLVLTTTGQRLENAALRGADQVSPDALATADAGLDTITVWSLAAACLLVAAVCVVRRSLSLALAAIGTIVAGQVITQTLKRFVLPRPGLVEASADYTSNSFPSGHTTIALTVLAAALVVAPSRWRGVTLFFVAGWATSIGAYTLTAKWHRLSDTLGAAGVALLVASLAALWLHHRGHVRPVSGRPRRARVYLVVIPLALITLTGLALGGFLLAATDDPLAADPIDEYNVYLALQSLAGAGSAATALAMWWGWHRLEAAP